jgi:DNA-binding response OmpR family regulator
MMARILLVDDEPEIRVLTRMMLEKAGYEVMEAKDGEEGLRSLMKDKPDLVLLDIMLPGDDGWEVCRKIKANEKTGDIPVVMFTVRTSEDSVKKSMDYAHADAQIDKPFDRKELLATVERILKKDVSC